MLLNGEFEISNNVPPRSDQQEVLRLCVSGIICGMEQR